MVLDGRSPPVLGGVGVTLCVELFGVPRVLAGARAIELALSGPTLADVARAVALTCPALRGSVIGDDGWLVSGYQFAVDGRFTRDPATAVGPGSTVLLLASSAGG